MEPSSPRATPATLPPIKVLLKSIADAGDGLPSGQFKGLPRQIEHIANAFFLRDLGLIKVVDENADERRYVLTEAGIKCLRTLTPWVYKPTEDPVVQCDSGTPPVGDGAKVSSDVFTPGDNPTRAWVGANQI